MKKGIIFDFDGLIIDTEYAQYQAWVELYQENGCSLPLSEWAVCIGTADNFDPVDFLQRQVNHPLDRKDLETRQRERSSEIIALEPVMPGVRKLVERSRRSGIKLAVASSSSREWVCEHLERVRLLSFFDVIRTREDVAQVKPEPELFLSALDGLGLQKPEAVVFEDSPNGITAALRAGIFCIAVPNRLTSQLDTSQANLSLRAISDLPFEDLLHLNGKSHVH